MFGWNVPDLLPEETLHEVWLALGLKGAEGPILWREMMAYATLAGEDLGHEEWRIVREMSEAYCAELQKDGPLVIPPMERTQRE